jgi:ABC-2 type transport system permease protein
MSSGLSRTYALAQRVLRQLLRDRRFLGLSLFAPLILIYLLKIFFDSLNSPLFQPLGFIMPATAFIVHFITYILAAIVLVRERTLHTLDRMLVNGYRQNNIIAGYVGAYSVVATLQSLLILTEVKFLFDLTYSANTWLSLFLITWLLAVISIALGIFVSNFARNEGQVFPFIPMVIVPSVFLSGLIIPLEKLPDWAQWLGHAVPLLYANEVIRNLIEPAGAISADWGSFAGLPVYGIVVFFLAAVTLRETE